MAKKKKKMKNVKLSFQSLFDTLNEHKDDITNTVGLLENLYNDVRLIKSGDDTFKSLFYRNIIASLILLDEASKEVVSMEEMMSGNEKDKMVDFTKIEDDGSDIFLFTSVMDKISNFNTKMLSVRHFIVSRIGTATIVAISMFKKENDEPSILELKEVISRFSGVDAGSDDFEGAYHSIVEKAKNMVAACDIVTAKIDKCMAGYSAPVKDRVI